MNLKQSPPDRIVRVAETSRITGVSRSSIYAKLDTKSPNFDATWPSPVRLSARAVGYRESELLAWLNTRPRAQTRNSKEEA